MKAVLAATLADLPEPGAGCACASWADELDLPYEVPGRGGDR